MHKIYMKLLGDSYLTFLIVELVRKIFENK